MRLQIGHHVRGIGGDGLVVRVAYLLGLLALVRGKPVRVFWPVFRRRQIVFAGVAADVGQEATVQYGLNHLCANRVVMAGEHLEGIHPILRQPVDDLREILLAARAVDGDATEGEWRVDDQMHW